MNNLRKYFSVWLVFITGFMVSILAFTQLHSVETHRHQLEFKTAVTERAEALRDELTLYLSVLEASTAFFYASEGISAQEFAIFTTPLLNQRKSLYLLEWVPAVPHSQRAAYELLAQQYQPHFQFTEYEISQQLITANQRPYYFPAYYLNSIDPKLAQLGPNGFDLGSEGQRLETLERARDTGETVITPWMSLLQLQGTHPVLPYGFLMIKPVYQTYSAKDSTVRERRKQLRGFVVGGFILEDLIKEAFHHLTD
jgi:CHASE1-domain containing sensor protein